MGRAFLVVIDSVGIGGAPDAGDFFNGDLPDTGANTLGHIAQACAAGKAEEGRSGPLALSNLDRGWALRPKAAGGLRRRFRRAKTPPRAIGNCPGCRCHGLGITSPMRLPPFLQT